MLPGDDLDLRLQDETDLLRECGVLRRAVDREHRLRVAAEARAAAAEERCRELCGGGAFA